MVVTAAVDFLENFFISIGPGAEPKFPHVPAALRSVWFLTPRQHAIETLSYLVIFIPMSIWAYKKALQHRLWKTQASIRPATVFDWTLAALTMASFAAVCYYKSHSTKGWRLLYMFQPCHVEVFVLACLCVARGKWANFLFQVYVPITWGAVAALAFPDMSDYTYFGDVFNFYYEHYVMLVVPIVLCLTGRYEYIGSPAWILFGFTVIALYHAIFLQLACLITEVNIATLMSPPGPLVSLGLMYRPAQYCICFVMHWIYNLLIAGGVKLVSSSSLLKPVMSPKQH
ncbi:Aste57867_22899 [Aphanomyces stellatus]|uniref:Aste57867_22899 protein n=1 Tax=Aphanomyces stellatus TaxID=120398 RepID=A0A485LL75_9STRA|nr:hypothetical protein As57867_022828 [Aphanomyces stellatus]VFT99549.1 Aste57867_22899 [Aphanomyces stellatus]